MKKEQKKLPPFELKAEKIVNKYADHKKLKNFHNEISHMFKTFAETLLKAEFKVWITFQK
ncbi:hypothetical protein [Mesomycoplasma dispar]|uniref:Uncharacterized protein n=1 Tax=Mesomycoplasma dispar TaxID=86660 RepID=A0ABN5DR73_9BACT|nr:hypothetical protein [Mesomycoplasma dispar]ATP59701.1 hypothetical protein CSW10_02010 [Mesomycoplasma dispar]